MSSPTESGHPPQSEPPASTQTDHADAEEFPIPAEATESASSSDAARTAATAPPTATTTPATPPADSADCYKYVYRRTADRRYECLFQAAGRAAPRCGKTYGHVDKLKAHHRHIHERFAFYCQCTICGRRCASTRKLRMHQYYTHEQRVPSPGPPGHRACPVCSWLDRIPKRGWLRHMNSKHLLGPGGAVCADCGQPVASWAEYERHLEEVHEGPLVDHPGNSELNPSGEGEEEEELPEIPSVEEEREEPNKSKKQSAV